MISAYEIAGNRVNRYAVSIIESSFLVTKNFTGIYVNFADPVLAAFRNKETTIFVPANMVGFGKIIPVFQQISILIVYVYAAVIPVTNQYPFIGSHVNGVRIIKLPVASAHGSPIFNEVPVFIVFHHSTGYFPGSVGYIQVTGRAPSDVGNAPEMSGVATVYSECSQGQ